MTVRRPYGWLFRAAVLAAIPFGLLTFSVPQAAGLPPVSWTKWYYSDSDFQNYVGEKTLWCNGSTYQEGTTSGYSLTVVSEGCQGGAPDGIRTTTCYVWWPPNGPFSTIPCH